MRISAPSEPMFDRKLIAVFLLIATTLPLLFTVGVVYLCLSTEPTAVESVASADFWHLLLAELPANLTLSYLLATVLFTATQLTFRRHVRVRKSQASTHRDDQTAPSRHAHIFNTSSSDISESSARAIEAINKPSYQELEHEIQTLRNAAADALKTLEARTSFLATVSHEIRTPLNAILGLLHLIELTSKDNPEVQNHAVTALAAGQNLLELLTNTIETARLEANAVEIHPVATNLRSLAYHWLDTTEATLSRRGKTSQIAVSLTFDAALDNTYFLDGGRLSQVVGNLTDNAAKFVDHGQIELEVTQVVIAPEEIPQAVIKVRDTGPGINKSDHKKIFERFKQVDQGNNRTHSGSGLGLTISKDIATLMGATLSISQAPPPGFSTEFTLTLPLIKTSDCHDQ